MSTDSSSSESKLQTAKAVLTAAGSVAATVVVARSIVNDLLPDEFHSYISSTVRSLFGWFSSELTLIIEEFDGIESNHIYESANLYLGTKTKFNTKNTPRRLKISRPETDPAINITVDRGEPISDYYDGVWYTWTLVCSQIQNQKYFYNPRDMNSTLKSEVKSLEITFNKKHKEKTLNHFIPYVIEEAKKLKDEQKTIKLHTVSDESIWSGLNLNHPATFETIAMDPDEKKRIMEDLERFVRRKEYYKRVGKAWKRGYLLYGPPGTGKSSLIAAMANYLKFDVYDLELGALNSNSDLRSLLLATENRSILVVEDIDCTVQLKNREDDSPPSTSENNRPEKKVTLSGFLNFIDGLWSSCGDERIIIFTTNYKDKLDPALLRPGRMDVHIHMSYCTPSGFKILASNYIGLESHDLFEEIIELIKRVHVTPAEVAEQLMKEDEPQAALEGLIVFLNAKSVENNEKKEEANKSLECVEVCSTMVVGV